jgi:sugar phosphate isomerase/epimerase
MKRIGHAWRNDMQFGFLTDKVDDIEKAARLGFDAVELNVGAFGRAGEAALEREEIGRAKELTAQHNIVISALAYYDASFAPPAPENFQTAYTRVFDAAEELGVGCDEHERLRLEPELGRKRATLGRPFWPGRCRSRTTRTTRSLRKLDVRSWALALQSLQHGRLARYLGRLVQSSAFQSSGHRIRPSHLYWQGIDHLRALHEYSDRVYHVHAKDTEMLPERRYRGGINGDFFRFRIPGYGEINWTHFVAALHEIGYDGGIAIEHEDPIYSGERFDEGLIRGWQTLYPLLHPQTAVSNQGMSTR